MKYYALYYKDNVISHGTRLEISKATGKKLNNLDKIRSQTKKGIGNYVMIEVD